MTAGLTQPSTCSQLESQFRESLISTVSQVNQSLGRDANCLRQSHISDNNCAQIREQHLQQLRDYRDLTRRLHQEMADDFLTQARSELRPVMSQCFANGSGQAQLSDNIRVLRSNDVSCLNLESQWSSELSRNLVNRLNGQPPSRSLTSAEIERLKAYHFSPLTRVIEAGALYDQRYSAAQLQAAMANALTNLSRSAERLRSSLADMAPRHHYLLYDFDSGLEAFSAGLSEADRAKISSCREQSTFTQACVMRATQDLSQCGQRVWSFALENVSIIAVVNAYSRLQRLQGAEVAEVMSSENLLAGRTEAMTAFVFSAAAHLGLVRPLVRGGQQLARNIDAVGSVLPRPASRFMQIESAPHVQLYGMEGRRPRVALEPGRSYTAVVQDDQLILGESISGLEGGAPGSSGSHVTLMRLSGARWPNEYEGEGGAIRFNLDGSIDISGYHLGHADRDAANLIRTMILRAHPDAIVRVTGGRLSELPPP